MIVQSRIGITTKLLTILAVLVCLLDFPAPAVSAPQSTGSVAQANRPKFEGSVSDWHGFQKYEFSVSGQPAYVVCPKDPAPGLPWVFRARFPNFHSRADQILLERGFHIARVDTDGWFGSPKAMQVWDAMYQQLTEQGLASRCALEGVSRGGLFVYGFAARWPERVACIYADTPVGDLKSWPGGRGKGVGSAPTWKQMLTAIEHTEATFEEYPWNPIDQLEPIAKARIPILHIVSRNDRVVPPEENTDVIRARLKKLGHDLRLIEVAVGTAQSQGHHFEHPAPVRVADFIERHASVIPDGRDSIFERGRLGTVLRRFDRVGSARVAFVGGSITNMDPGWRSLTMQYLRERYPATRFEFINAGIPSTGSVPGAFRLKQDVLQQGDIDLLFEEASVNDVTNGRTPAQMTRGMEGIVRQLRRDSPDTGVVVMHFACPVHSEDYRQGRVPKTVRLHEDVAQHYEVSSIHLAEEVVRRIDAGQFDWKHDFRNLHPSAYGHRLYAASIRRLLSSAWAAEERAAAELPEPVDRWNYSHGSYGDLSEAETLSGFKLIPNCDPRKVAPGGVRPGFVDVDMLVGSQVGDSLAYLFEGTGVGILVAAGPDAGWIEFQVDDGPWRQVNLFTRWSARLHLPWAYVLADELSPGQHRLQLRVSEQPQGVGPTEGGSTGNACRIVQFLVNAEK